MALLARNLTLSPVVLAASSVPVTLPASGQWVNVTSELDGLTNEQYTSLEAQRPGVVEYKWTGPPLYSAGSLQSYRMAVGLSTGTDDATTGSQIADAAVRRIVFSSLISTGVDGAAVLDGTNEVPWATRSGFIYTMIRDGVPTYLETSPLVTLNTPGHRLFVSGDVWNRGTIQAKGNDAAGQTAGAVQTNGSLFAGRAGGLGGAAAGNGQAGGAGTTDWPNVNHYQGGTGGGGGGGTTGGATGSVTAVTADRGTLNSLSGLMAMYQSQAASTGTVSGCGGGGGGGGAAAAGGGGGGGAPELILIIAGKLTNDGVLGSFGGNGAQGLASDAGSGAGGGGNRVVIACSDFEGNEPETLPGLGGAASGGTGKIAGCGLPGKIVFYPPRDTRGNVIQMEKRWILTTAERTAVSTTTAGYHRITMTVPAIATMPGVNTVSVTTSRGGGGFAFYDLVTAEGRFAAVYDSVSNEVDIIVGGTVRTTLQIAANPAAPTLQMWQPGDTIDIDFAYPSNGSGNARFRMAVNRSMGNDTIFAASGALTAVTSGVVLGTEAGWAPTTDIFTSVAPTANKICDVVLIGDSITAPRSQIPGVGTLMYASTLTIRSLAQGGATLNAQLATWQACAERGQASVQAVIINGGANDIIAGDTAATIASDFQAIVTDVTTNNPTAKRIGCKMTPFAFYLTVAQRAVWVAANDNYAGTGANPVTGLDQIVVAHVAEMGDSNFALRDRGDASDHLHPSRRGRRRYAARIVEKLIIAGITL